MRNLVFAGLLCSSLVLADQPRPSHPSERPAPPATPERPWPTTERRLPPPAELSPMVRQLLRERMARHGKIMSELVQAVIVLDHAQTARLAREIVEEPRLARPLSQNGAEINASLPEPFFQLQDELRRRATRLAEAARTRDHADLAPAFGQLTETCVSCHRVYSTGRAP